MSRALLTAFLLFLSAVGYSQENVSDKIDRLLSAYDKPNSPGMSIGVIQNGKLIYSKGLGLASVENKLPNTSTTVFEVASIAKQFTAACIWVLVQKKQISPEDDIRKYLPEMPDYGTPVKIKHLLNHTSGIRNYHAVMALQGFGYDSEYYNNQTVLELACRQKGLNNIPGEKVLYSNTNYNLLAIIIERVSKMNLNEFARQNIFTPLKMQSAFFKISAGMSVTYTATGYQITEGKYITNSSIQESYGAGSMGTSVQDLANWTAVLNNTNTKFKSLTKFLTTSERLPDGTIAKYARGVMVDNYKGYKTISHSGYAWGGEAQIITLPEKQLGVVILTNLEDINPTPLSYQIIDLFLPYANGKASGTANINYLADIKDAKLFTGQYKEINSDMKMEIFIDNDTLKAKGTSARNGIALLATEKNKFRRKNNQSVEYDFSKSSSHDMMVSFGGTPFYFKKAHFVNPDEVNNENFIGDFYSEELQVTYHFYESEKKLYLSYAENKKIPLSTVQENEFGNSQRTLYHFEWDNGRVTKMLLSSEGTVKNILFTKL